MPVTRSPSVASPFTSHPRRTFTPIASAALASSRQNIAESPLSSVSENTAPAIGAWARPGSIRRASAASSTRYENPKSFIGATFFTPASSPAALR